MDDNKTHYLKLFMPRNPALDANLSKALDSIDEIVWRHIEALQKRVDALEKTVSELQRHSN